MTYFFHKLDMSEDLIYNTYGLYLSKEGEKGMSKTAVVTGGSSGIGQATAQALRQAGCTVYEFSRRDIRQDGIRHISCDVTKPKDVEAAIEEVIAKEGKIDILINNAGFGISGATEYTRSEDAHKLMEVNVFGMANVTRAVLPHMRRAGSGRIVNTSSVAGVLPIPFQTWYSVSKAAVNAYTQAVDNEVRPYGVRVCAVMPGDMRTGFTAAREKNSLGDDEYGGRIARSVSRMEKDEQNGMNPMIAGKYIARTALRRSVKPLRAIGFSYKLFCVIGKLLPVRLVNYLLGRMYAN